FCSFTSYFSALFFFFFFQAEDGIRDFHVTGVQTCALPILAALSRRNAAWPASSPSPAPQSPRAFGGLWTPLSQQAPALRKEADRPTRMRRRSETPSCHSRRRGDPARLPQRSRALTPPRRQITVAGLVAQDAEGVSRRSLILAALPCRSRR